MCCVVAEVVDIERVHLHETLASCRRMHNVEEDTR